MTPRIIGRSSSSFTRVTRIFASELGIEYELAVVRDLQSLRAEDYAGNPTLKLPVLQTVQGAWYGALNICRALADASSRDLRIAWPEGLREPLLANAQELAVHALATEVTLVMSRLGGSAGEGPHQTKLHASLGNTMTWLDANLGAVLAALPSDRDLSYLEVTLFCLVTHLEFRDVLPVADYPALTAFCQRFGQRASALDTLYRFDA